MQSVVVSIWSILQKWLIFSGRCLLACKFLFSSCLKLNKLLTPRHEEQRNACCYHYPPTIKIIQKIWGSEAINMKWLVVLVMVMLLVVCIETEGIRIGVLPCGVGRIRGDDDDSCTACLEGQFSVGGGWRFFSWFFWPVHFTSYVFCFLF